MSALKVQWPASILWTSLSHIFWLFWLRAKDAFGTPRAILEEAAKATGLRWAFKGRVAKRNSQGVSGVKFKIEVKTDLGRTVEAAWLA